MKFKKIVSAVLTAAMVVTGAFSTVVFAEKEQETGVVLVNESAEKTAGETETEAQVSLEAETYPYQNTALSFEERAADLVSRMTLEQKVSQLGYNAPEIKNLGVGRYRYWREALHGVGRQDKATSFPQSLAMSNTWDPDLIYRAADITSTEARAKNGTTTSEGGANRFDLSYWSPTINMARDPRWGRNEEGYGEDPFLTGQYGIQFINGMQGNDEKYLKTIPTIKHFIANNCEGERRTGSSVMDEQTLRDYYARAFQDVTEQANPGSVMSSYNATTVTRNGKILYDYIPSPANSYTLNDLLRRTWGFSGYVVGDCGALGLLNSTRAYKRTLFPDATDKEALDAIPQSATIPYGLRAGNDLDCGSGGDAYQAHTFAAVKDGYAKEDDVDLAVYRLMLMRMKTGEFDGNDAAYKNLTGKTELLETDEHIVVAEEAAEKSWVLLKNKDNFLPVKSSAKKVAIVGNMAGEAFLGGYSGTPEKTVSPYDGLVKFVENKAMDTEIAYLGSVTDETELFGIKSIQLLDGSGNVKVTPDFSKATVSGCTISGKTIEGVTPKAEITVPNVNFKDVKTVKIELENVNSSIPSGNIQISYNTVSRANIPFNNSSTVISGVYADDGGYTETANLRITINVNSDFSVEKYKTQLDEADAIIAYAGTTLDDSNESRDRKNISLPANQSHVKAIADAYPDKTIVVMQTAGQIDVSPFENNCKAILWNCYNGQTQGTAFAKIIFGEISPSGKLSTTWYDPADLENKLNLNGIHKTDETDNGIDWIRNDYSIRQRSELPENFPKEFSADFVGRTYQYYKGNPVYPFGYGLSYTSFEYGKPQAATTADVNGKLSVTVDIKNAGTVKGAEVVQLYVKSPEGDGIKLPLKQLKGFSRVELEPGETKTVTIESDIKGWHFYNEETASTYIPTGEYTIMVGGDSKFAEENSVKVNVTGTRENKLETVTAIPSGIELIGTVYADGTRAQSVKEIDPGLSACMTDETFIKNPSVVYTSSDEAVAYIENGKVKANTKEGVALITATVTEGDVTKTTSFPVVSVIKKAITDEQRAAYKKSLDDLYSSYDSAKYSAQNWTLMTNTYNDALKRVKEEFDNDVLKADVDSAIKKMKSIKVKPTAGTELYHINSFTDTLYNEVEVDIVNNTDAYEPKAVLIASVYDGGGKLVKEYFTDITDSGKYKISGNFENNEKMNIYVWDSTEKMTPLSNKYDHTYVAQERPSYMVYNFNDSAYDVWKDLSDGTELEQIQGLNAYGKLQMKTGRNYTYEYTKNDGTKETIKFTRGFQAGSGKVTQRCIYFKPLPGYSKCKVTVVYYNEANVNEADEGKRRRIQYIGQPDAKGNLVAAATGDADPSTYLAFSAEFDDLSKPIYTWGGGNNKTVLGIIVEYTK